MKLIGGQIVPQRDATSPPHEYMWLLRGKQWSPIRYQHEPGFSFAEVAASPSGDAISYGGSPGAIDVTWRWNGTDWQSIGPSCPSAELPHLCPGTGQVFSPEVQLSGYHAAGVQFNGAVMFDGTKYILYGGHQGNGGGVASNDAWTWDGMTWSQLHPAHRPPVVTGGTLARNDADHQLLLFGGQDETGPTSQTWTWDGADWTELHPRHYPPPRRDATAAFDPALGGVVLFGGLEPARAYYNDTWLWKAGDWTSLDPQSRPTGRSQAAIGFDPKKGALLMFGGLDPGGALNDTWSFDGQGWHEIQAGR